MFSPGSNSEIPSNSLEKLSLETKKEESSKMQTSELPTQIESALEVIEKDAQKEKEKTKRNIAKETKRIQLFKASISTLNQAFLNLKEDDQLYVRIRNGIWTLKKISKIAFKKNEEKKEGEYGSLEGSRAFSRGKT